MVSAAASSSRLPDYPVGPQDVLSRVASLSALHHDPSDPAYAALLSNLVLSKDSASLWANSQSGITVCPQAMSSDRTDLEVSQLVCIRSSEARRGRPIGHDPSS